MKNKKQVKYGHKGPCRLFFPEDVRVHPWLSMLIEAYYIVDKGIAEAVRLEERKGKKLACRRGCSHCCKTHNTIPVYPLELVGLSWYVSEKLGGPRELLKKQLRDYRETDPCPFLIDGVCSVHPLRPVSCRQFNVFNQPCAEGEDPFYTRRVDVLTPLRNYVDRAFFIMLPFYGVVSEQERWKIIESNSVHQFVKLMQTCNWKSLADKMDEFERRAGDN